MKTVMTRLILMMEVYESSGRETFGGSSCDIKQPH